MRRISPIAGILVLFLALFSAGNLAYGQTAADWQLDKEAVEVLFGDLFDCLIDLDDALDLALEGAETQSSFQIKEWIQGNQTGDAGIDGFAKFIKDDCIIPALEEIQQALEDLIDNLDWLENGIGTDVSEEGVEAIKAKIQAELQAVWAWIALAWGTMDSFNEIFDEICRDGKLNDLTDVAVAPGLSSAVRAGIYANIAEVIKRLIAWKELIIGSLFFNEQLGPLVFGGFGFYAQALLGSINFQVDCLEGDEPVEVWNPETGQLEPALDSEGNPLNGGLGTGLTCLPEDPNEVLANSGCCGSVTPPPAPLAAALPLTVQSTYATPNPATLGKDSQVRFVAEGTGISEVQVEIYDLAGGKIYNSGMQSGNALSWNLLNGNGQSVANGVYLYVVTAKGANGQVVRNEVQKLVVLK